jgi:nitroreductase
MDALAALTSRVSAVKLADPAPEGEALRAILDAGLRAPDHGRLRPFRFLLVRGAARTRFGELLAAALKRQQPDAPDALLAREREKAMRAPLIVVVAARVTASPKVPEIEQVVAAGAAAENMFVAAHALGFGVMWKTGAPAYDAEVKRALGLEAQDHIVAFLYLGTPAAPVPEKRPDPAGVVADWPG